jgi:hypothetical protein
VPSVYDIEYDVWIKKKFNLEHLQTLLTNWNISESWGYRIQATIT